MLTTHPSSPPAEPAWDIARLFPAQGHWTPPEFFALHTNRQIEFHHGFVEVLPMPSPLHQFISRFLFRLLDAFAQAHDLGEALYAPAYVLVDELVWRDPDVLFLLKEHRGNIGKRFISGADLIMEIVSEDDPDRDWVTKRQEYARAKVTEYWIVDPRTRRIVVLSLSAGTGDYQVAGEYHAGDRAASILLPGFEVDVTQTFAAGDQA